MQHLTERKSLPALEACFQCSSLCSTLKVVLADYCACIELARFRSVESCILRASASFDIHRKESHTDAMVDTPE